MEKYCRIVKDGQLSYALLEEGMLRLLEGDLFEDHKISDHSFPFNEVTFLAPCQPSKVICLGLNYREHAFEMEENLPRNPILFIKPATSVIGPSEMIVWPNDVCLRLDYEAELAVVIGKKGKDIKMEQAGQYIFGYTCANDVTARDLQASDGQWTRAKSFDTFCPLGPVIVKGIDCGNLNISCRLNGEIKQASNTGQLIFGVAEIVSFVSSIMTLLPGDVILTGTPSGIGPMSNGDIVEVEIEGIGILRNTVTLRISE